MSEQQPLSQDFLADLLKTEKRQSTPRQRKNVFEPREYSTWWKLPHRIREEGCSNPDCIDTRPKTDKGTNIVVEMPDGKDGTAYCCRYCFLGGWLTEVTQSG
jgi:hypothetical protein